MKPYKIRLKKGDLVMVRRGKYKGHTGKITAVYPSQNKAVVEGINVTKKHRKPTKVMPQGGIVEFNRPIDVSKLGIYDTVKKKPSRIGIKVSKDGTRVRLLKTSGKEIKQ